MNRWLIYLNLIIPMFIKVIIPDGRYGVITIFTDWIILPITLIAINIILFFFNIEVSFLKCSFFMLLGLLIGDGIGYGIWGISSKNLFAPDAETIWISKSIVIYHICVVGIFFLIFKGGQFLFQAK